MTIRERLIEYIDLKGITKYRFCKETGLSNGFLDKEGAIGSDKCENICSRYTDLNPEWLLLGKGQMTKPINTLIQIEENLKNHENKDTLNSLVDKIIELSSENALLKEENIRLKNIKRSYNDSFDNNIAAEPSP